jgi:creatinine amidohydrolase/Fe(II)-dependent formamide hydrolase-like protein
MVRRHQRLIAELTSPEISKSVRKNAILCLPIGSIEQHGPHLPLNTDTVLAEAFTRAIIARWSAKYDLWQLPPLTFGLSQEHAWAAGTISLKVETMTALLRNLASEIARALPARNLAVINGHGGNRGILEALGREIAGDFGVNFCALHLGAMMSPPSGAAFVEIHGGMDETSAMLALAPELVRRDLIERSKPPADSNSVKALILDPAVSWPWNSNDKRIAHSGIIGNARAASAKHGQAIVARVVEAAGDAFKRLLQNRRR